MPGPGGLLALDLSGRTGVAYGHGPIPDWYRLWRFPQPTRGGRFNAFRSEFVDTIDQWQPSRVAMEAPLHPRAQRDEHSARQQFGLAAYVEGECDEAGIPCMERNADEVRRRIIGRTRSRRAPPGSARADLFGRAVEQSIKDMVVEHVRRLGLPIADDNIADAICLYLAVMSEERHTRIQRMAA